jgi:broad specificity phosphatase PhoE
MKLILIRHGETAWNRHRRIQGSRSNTQLNEIGYEQADRIASLLKQQRIDAIYSSPLKRATDTAQAIARACGLQIRTTPELQEIDAGELDGLSEQDMGDRYLAFWAEWRKGDPSLHLPGGESLQELQRRVWWAIERVLERHPNDTVALVGHLFTNLVIISRALGLDLHNMRRLRLDPASISIIEFTIQGNTLLLFNDTCHLRE